MPWLLPTLWALLGGAFAAPAAGQQMRQGEAHITTRAEVRLSLESVPGTSGARLGAIGQAVGAAMPAIRRCYDEVVEARPAVTGTMRLRISLPTSADAAVDVTEDGTGDPTLARCVRGVIARQRYADVARPAAAVVVLEMHNSAAAGAVATERRAAEADAVSVEREDGRPSAQGEAPGVRFVVLGEPETTEELVAEAFRVVRSQVAGMLDCRRRASRRRMDPSGQIDLRMQMRRDQPPAMTVVASTVRDERAPACLERALERPPRRPSAGPAQFEVRITFLAERP